MPQETTIEKRLAHIEALAARGLKPAAAQLSRLILEKDPQHFEALLWLARTAPQTDEADKALQRAAQLRPDDHVVQELLTARAPAPQPAQTWNGAGMPTNPYNPAAYPGPTPNYGAPPPGYAPTGAGYPPPGYYGQPGTPPGYSPAGNFGNQPQPNTYDYLRTPGQIPGASPIAPPIPLTTPPPAIPTTPKVKSDSNPVGLTFGLLFIIAGIVLGTIWTMQILAFNDDINQSVTVLDGQITRLSTERLVADIKGQGTHTYNINESTYKTLEPLVRDTKSNQGLSPNAVKLSVTPDGHLAQIEVQSPNKGIASTKLADNGLLGLGTPGDWALTALSGILAVLGLLILGRSLGKSRP
jgi:hypothetical protein